MEIDPHVILQYRLSQAGSQRALAQELGVSESYIAKVLAGQEPGKAILNPLGIERVVTYKLKAPKSLRMTTDSTTAA